MRILGSVSELCLYSSFHVVCLVKGLSTFPGASKIVIAAQRERDHPMVNDKMLL